MSPRQDDQPKRDALVRAKEALARMEGERASVSRRRAEKEVEVERLRKEEAQP